jgi:hypothetical protein
MSSIADMSADSGDLTLPPATPAAGRNATDRAIRSARMVRPMHMGLAGIKIAGSMVMPSSDDFARRHLSLPGDLFLMLWTADTRT